MELHIAYILYNHTQPTLTHTQKTRARAFFMWEIFHTRTRVSHVRFVYLPRLLEPGHVYTDTHTVCLLEEDNYGSGAQPPDRDL